MHDDTCDLMRAVLYSAADFMQSRGFGQGDPKDGYPSVQPGTAHPEWMSQWFVNQETVRNGVGLDIVVNLEDDGDRGVRLTGTAYITATDAARYLGEAPVDSLGAGGRERPLFEIDSVDFGYLDHPKRPSHIAITLESQIEGALVEFGRLLDGPVQTWVDGYGSPEKLANIALLPAFRFPDVRQSPSPLRLRMIVAVLVINAEFELAADVIARYLQQDRFTAADSCEKALVFDTFLRQQSLEYAAERTRTEL